MVRHLIHLFLITLLLSCAGTGNESNAPLASISFIETVDSKDGEIVIPYSKYRLANGLTVILHEDTSDPLVHVDVTYHVGSAREESQRSGFAHFFEHMMFQGSANVADEEHFKIVTELGGTLNGTTNSDRTNYFETVPSNNLETMLWLEADRMGFLLEAVTQEKFEVQRATVKNERGQNVENRPYGRFNEINGAALFPAGHPYSWPVIGYPEDLDAATLDDLKKFFLRWYGPNNATLTIGGNINKDEALKLVNKYFGPIPRGPEVEQEIRRPVQLDRDRYVSYVDKNIRFPALLMTFPTVPFNHPDRIALEALNDIMGGSKKSLFYKKFVLTRKAIQANGFNNSQELAGSITFLVLPFPGTPLSAFEIEMRELLDNFSAADISDEDMQIYKAGQESGLVQSLAAVRGKVSQLAFYETLLQDPNTIGKELEAVRNLSKEDVLRVFNRYVKGKDAVVQSVVPENMPDGQARPDNFTLPAPLPRTASATTNLEPRKANETFDRSVRPTPKPAPLVPVPDFWKTNLQNGVEVIGTLSDEIPLVTIRLSFDGGHLLDDPELHGLANLTAIMMNEGTEKLSAEQFEIELDKLGSRISVGAGRDNTDITLVSLKDNLDATLDLLEQRLFESKFTDDDLTRLRQQEIEGLEANKKQPSSIANDVYRTLLYGKGHQLAVSANGTQQTLEKITLADIERFSKANLNSASLQVVVVGDVARTEIIPRLEFLNRLPSQGLAKQNLTPTPDHKDNAIFLVDKPGAAQSEIRIGYLTDLPYDATGEYFRRDLMNYVLGSAFNSRINLNLREDKGYTYGARARFSGGKLPGPYTASASVLKEATADSVTQFINELRAYREEGITQDELAFMRSAIAQSDALDYETPWQKAGFLGQIIEYDLPRNFVEQQTTIINTISQEEINQLAKRYLPLEKMVILVVGDKETTLSSLKELGYPIVELNTDGEPVSG
jgi:zinc protease